MSANVETMFYTREKPWHGLGTRVENALDSKEALVAAGLDWKVIQKPIMTDDGNRIPGFKANVRDTDQQILGVVTDRYKVPSPLQISCWAKAFLMRRRDPCRTDGGSGCLQSCRRDILSAEMRSSRIWYS